MRDVFLYSGGIERGHDLRFIEFVANNKNHDEMTLILVTPGGNPDAAYKMGRYLQSRYNQFSCLIPGFCKSAGTLLAIAAYDLAFAPYGELGPLDVQLTKTDDLFGQESGLNISEAFRTVENRAKQTYHALVGEIISGSGGVVSFQTASHCAAEIVESLYGPIFGSIDPEEVGSRARAMRLGEDYGLRLNQKFKNLKENALEILSQSYSSHGFVIDADETCQLFERVRMAELAEQSLIQELGLKVRHPSQELVIENHSVRFEELVKEASAKGNHGEEEHSSGNDASGPKAGREEGGAKPNGGDPSPSSTGQRFKASERPEPAQQGGGRARA